MIIIPHAELKAFLNDKSASLIRVTEMRRKFSSFHELSPTYTGHISSVVICRNLNKVLVNGLRKTPARVGHYILFQKRGNDWYMDILTSVEIDQRLKPSERTHVLRDVMMGSQYAPSIITAGQFRISKVNEAGNVMLGGMIVSAAIITEENYEMIERFAQSKDAIPPFEECEYKWIAVDRRRNKMHIFYNVDNAPYKEGCVTTRVDSADLVDFDEIFKKKVV